MRNKLIVLLIFPALILAQNSQKKIVASQFMVYGNCEMCKKTIEKAALSIKGVKMAKIGQNMSFSVITQNFSIIFYETF